MPKSLLQSFLRHSLHEKEHNELLQKQKYPLEEELSDANERAGLAQEEVSLYKVKNSKLSEQNVKLMASLTNSKSPRTHWGSN